MKTLNKSLFRFQNDQPKPPVLTFGWFPESPKIIMYNIDPQLTMSNMDLRDTPKINYRAKKRKIWKRKKN